MSRSWRSGPTSTQTSGSGFFVVVFAVVALWELAAPRRALTVSKALRWGSNLGLVVLNTVCCG